MFHLFQRLLWMLYLWPWGAQRDPKSRTGRRCVALLVWLCLCGSLFWVNPMSPRPKALQCKKLLGLGNGTADRKGSRAQKKAINSVEDQVSALLLKTAGMLKDEEATSGQAIEMFSGQFVQPLLSDVVGGMREAFGLPPVGGADCLSALVADGDA
jgi:hypothetical protein